MSHWYPDTEYSGCILTQSNKELPASKSTTATVPVTTTKKTNSTKNDLPKDPLYYDQFLKTTTSKPKTTIIDANSTIWYELLPENISTTVLPEDEWENIGPQENDTQMEKLKDVELLFDNTNSSSLKIKRSTFELYERFRKRRLYSESNQNGQSSSNTETVKFIVTCRNSRRFRSARERWWFIAISNCGSAKGLDVRYKFLMTNGPSGDFWHEHFSADEFYVLPILLAYTFAYVIVMVAVVMCSVELKTRHLLHSTYKLFLISIVAQHFGVILQSLAGIRYAYNGIGNPASKVIGQFLCGVSETCYLLLLILLAKGYTITRGRLKVAFTVKLTVFMCCYVITYVVLFVYQAKAFDPGEVLYLYESPAGYGLIVLRLSAWCAFAYATFFTVRKFPEKVNGNTLDRFGPTPYHPSGGTSQTVIIPLTRRTEELIGNMYNQYMASAPPLSIENQQPKINAPKSLASIRSGSLVTQNSSETNKSDDIQPAIKEIYTVDGQINKMDAENETILPEEKLSNELVENTELPIVRLRRNILEPIKKDVPDWSLAKGPCVVAMQLKKIKTIEDEVDSELPPLQINGKKVLRNGQTSVTEMGTIHEGREKTYIRSPADIFTVTTRS
ncbi:unnamed protein product [Danaus chrysippus]|uniref:(African queen) hypothetical protein n=1 Tax=Danaus chrysippus TaxID=151541 RepID=A0A8J2QYJ9_9NEOP|nr:unnamed protein product [Danaus chrysippus]